MRKQLQPKLEMHTRIIINGHIIKDFCFKVVTAERNPEQSYPYPKLRHIDSMAVLEILPGPPKFEPSCEILDTHRSAQFTYEAVSCIWGALEFSKVITGVQTSTVFHITSILFDTL
jgi:hypothetical protein